MQIMRPRLVGGFVALLAFAAPAMQGPAQAYDNDVVALQGSSAVRRVTMGVGKSIIVDLPADAGEIFVGNPAVANAVVRSARKIYIIGQTAGQTTIYAMDKQGRRIATLELSIGRDIGELQSIIRTALPNARIVARTVNDSIILTGEVDSPGDMQTALDIAKGFVDSVNKNSGGVGGATGAGMVVNAITVKGRDQVMIKVTIAEIQRNIAKQLGISSSTLAGNWGTFTQQNPFSINGGPLTDGALNTVTKFGGPWSLTQTLTAFERNGVARTLAEPTVTATSGESAKFTVGGEVPISAGTTCTGSGTSSSCAASVTYKMYGVTLNFTPVVLASGRISLRLATEVSDIDPATSASISGTVVPGFRTRRHDTTVELPTGGSIATAGLIESSSNQAINGVPGAMNLPILGGLFRSRDYQRKETELMIIVTPYLVKAVPASALARPDQNFADANDPQAWLLGRVNKLYSTTDNPEAARHLNGRVGFIHD
ncbi:type II and III secretion system protein family protein [Rhodoblastus sp. 17X3]|uniref:type II and III secretion system protein family protein n=1 Tax=Rhodoblastus sp. 17X3 TaxID=3047026 RepID=UPI0024B84AF0|nr:type II and III secretion system protein family protein [Rhodoblastus sp. 17X3]MDI9848450.1 type II and III secretion system protein family protein [Rhodoblastus sp. 17X3]